MTIPDAIDEYLSSKQNSVTNKTYRWYTQRLNLFAEYTKHLTSLDQVTMKVVQQFVASVPTDNTYTRHGYAQVVKGFLQWCSLDESFNVRSSLVQRIELPKVEISEVHPFSAEDIDKLFRACDRVPYPLRARAIVHLLLDTGIRVSELGWDSSRPEEGTGLRMENLVIERDTDSFIRVMGKGRKPRQIAIGKQTRSAISRYLKREREGDSNFVFLSRHGEPMKVRMVEQLITDLGGLAGVDPCYPHLFRHTFAVNCLLNGVSEIVLMRLLGHTSLEATKVYARSMSQEQAMKSAPSVVDTMRGVNKKTYH